MQFYLYRSFFFLLDHLLSLSFKDVFSSFNPFKNEIVKIAFLMKIYAIIIMHKVIFKSLNRSNIVRRLKSFKKIFIPFRNGIKETLLLMDDYITKYTYPCSTMILRHRFRLDINMSIIVDVSCIFFSFALQI